MDLSLGRGAWERERGAFPPWRQENCLLAASKTDPKGYNILSRPPLVSAYSWGAEPANGVFWKEGLLGGAKFAVIGSVLYENGTAKGMIDGSGPVKWAAGTDELVLTRGASAWSYDGSTLQAVAFPDGADVASVHWLARRFYYVRAGSGRFYWSSLDNGRSINALNYATAESAQDELLDIFKDGDVLWMMGANSGEAWVLTGDPDLPLSKVSQRTLDRGVLATGCGAEIEGGIYFISNDKMVCNIQNAAVRISDEALEEKIKASAAASAFWFQYEGKPLFCIRLDSASYVIDLAQNNQVSIFSTSGRANWAAQCAVTINGEPLFGDDSTGDLLQFDESAQADSGASQMVRIFSAGAAGNAFKIANVFVEGNSGAATAVSGIAADPVLEMRYSRDGGRTFQPWTARRWGRQGQFGRLVRFGSCGQFRAPGALLEFRMSACTPLRIASVRANESAAGRGWA